MMSRRTFTAVTVATLLTLLATTTTTAEDVPVEYGVDVSYPMHYPEVSKNYAWLKHNTDPNEPTPDEYKDMVVQPLGDRQSIYEDLIKGCVEFYDLRGRRCEMNEKERVEMSLRQPQGVHNYTELGFTKIRAPEHVFKLIKEFWEINRAKNYSESWPPGNTYVNHWEAPTKMLSVENPELKGGGFVLKQHIWNAARDTIQEWTGQKLAECSLYGIRIYEEGAVLATHVDRMPLVSSAIINVDQDVDEPWPLEVIGHDGKAHNVTMVPGDLVLYESHSILHGRPFPLKGRFMANVFIHFEPIGPIDGPDLLDGDLPPYIVRGSDEEQNWRIRNPNGHSVMSARMFETGTTEAHRSAMEGDLAHLQKAVAADESVVNAKDKNGWTPLHEGARAGDVSIVQFLISSGSDVNARTHMDGSGGSVLWWAHQTLKDESHEVIQLLKQYGAKNIAPGGAEL